MAYHIPIVDLAAVGLLKSDSEVTREDMEKVADEFKRNFTQTGFLYLKNHGISKEKLEAATKVTGEFFALPLEVKEKYAIDIKETNHGYIGSSKEILNKSSVAEMRESFDIRFKDGPFPDKELPLLRTYGLEVARDFEHLANRIMKILAIALGADDIDFLVKHHPGMLTETCETVIRFLNYPVFEGKADAGVVKLGEHSDWATCTMLYQDETGGLEVRSVDNSWLEATPIPDTLVFNVAEMLELWSAGRFPATKHRVFIRQNQKQKPRRSMAFFVAPELDVLVKPVDGSTELKPVSFRDHLKRHFTESYGGY